MGGTFDRLHAGRKKLLETTFKASKTIFLDLATEVLLKAKKHKDMIQLYEVRKQRVLDFARKHGREGDIIIVSLTDPYGPAITNEDIEAIVVSEETESGAKKINELRKRNARS